MSIPLVNSWSILTAVTLLLLTIRFVDRWFDRRIQRTFSEWARQNRFRYNPIDRFHLATRIRERLPHPGAADVMVRDVMYRTDQQKHFYLFTAYYRTGTICGQKWFFLVAVVQETKGRSCDRFDDLRVADTGSRLSRYESLLKVVENQ
ncbi:MAG: hypothetical protein KatS3mg104_2210 [Phycisphaerae bacterium]|nr:MAG: hypothetical protein KatS3mg104_2210 [Phycisphaerae bacterium]